MGKQTKSVWVSGVDMPSFEQLKGDLKTDVLIIGGGMAGVLTAYFLHKQGVKYVLLEQNRICGATTQNTTAKITLQHGFIYNKTLKDRGLETARAYYLANKAACDTFGSLCKDIDCDYTVKDNYVYSTDDFKKAEREMDALTRVGCKAYFFDEISVPVDIKGAVCVPNQAEFNPLKFISSISQGLNIYENTKVREMQGNIAVTNKGRVFADRVVVATHFPFINKHGSYFLKLFQHRSYVLALRNAANVKGMYVDESDSGLSFRNYGELLLLGGGGHRTGKKGGGWSALEQFYKEHYPKAEVEYMWATQDCMSLDGAAYIGRYSRSTDNMYVASGFNKWGMTGSMTAAMILCDMLMEKKNDLAFCFDPSRSILKPQLFVNGIETSVNLLTPTTKRCPHLGCALKWNPQEHSWDCPCHGSRFFEDGTLLDGPATANLKEKPNQAE